jgi:hypothetical protein
LEITNRIFLNWNKLTIYWSRLYYIDGFKIQRIATLIAVNLDFNALNCGRAYAAEFYNYGGMKKISKQKTKIKYQC